MTFWAWLDEHWLVGGFVVVATTIVVLGCLEYLMRLLGYVVTRWKP